MSSSSYSSSTLHRTSKHTTTTPPFHNQSTYYSLEPALAYDQQLAHSVALAALPAQWQKQTDDPPLNEQDDRHDAGNSSDDDGAAKKNSSKDAHLFIFTSPSAIHIVNYELDEDINTLFQHEFSENSSSLIHGGRIVTCDVNLLGWQYAYEIYDMNPNSSRSIIKQRQRGDKKGSIGQGAGTGSSSLECLYRYDWRNENNASPLKRAIMKSEKDSQVLLLTHDSCLLHDFESKAKPQVLFEKPRRLYCTDWDRLQQKIVLGVQRDVVEYDLRSNGTSYEIKNAHDQRIRDIQYNPQRPYYFVSAGDDNRMRYWDIRKPDAALKVVCGHSHWINRVRFNPLNDQLLLSASSDATICLWSLPSLAELQQEGTSGIEDDTIEGVKHDDSSSESSTQLSRGEDKLACRITEHDDSVTDICWSKQSPWVFASVSYDGRCVIHHVPNQLKYEILEI